MARSVPIRPAPPSPSEPAGWWCRDWPFVALVFLAVIVAYLPVWRAGFIWDDDSNLTSHPCIVGPLGFQEIWTSPASFYFPLVMSTFWLQHALWGLAPVPYHVVNVLFHALDAGLLWLVLRQLRIPGARIGALLWALHPVQVESVAWISELKNTESAVFYLLAILLFLRWVARRSAPGAAGGWYAGALLAAVAAILAKSSTVMLPVVLGLCWWWTDRSWRWRRVLWLLPFLGVSLGASGWTIWEQRYHSGALGAEWNQSLSERLIIAGRAIWFYAGKLAWPHPLIFIYPRWSPDTTHVASFLPAVAAGAVGIGLWFWRRAAPWCFAAAYFGVSLFPILGFFNVYFFRYSFVGDHFQYLASMGLLALAGAGIAVGPERLGARRTALHGILVSALLLALGALTWRQSLTYRDLPTFWQAIIERNPSCAMAHYNLGKLLQSQGRSTEAATHLEAAVALDPHAADAQTALGVILQDAGRVPEAIAHLEQAAQEDPHYALARNFLGIALAKAGCVPEAIAQLEEARRLDPKSADVRTNLGNALQAAGRRAEAMAQYREAVRLDPNFAMAHSNLAAALAADQQFAEAIDEFEQALRLNPAQTEVQIRLGTLLMVLGRSAEGIARFESALRLDPDSGAAHLNLAMALDSVGRSDEAATHYEAARRRGVVPPDGSN
jgi:protein O-mannosyl-transferase